MKGFEEENVLPLPGIELSFCTVFTAVNLLNSQTALTKQMPFIYLTDADTSPPMSAAFSASNLCKFVLQVEVWIK